jgi:hypothetical protein
MTTLYPYPGAAGPWACDDSRVTCDGFLRADNSYEPSGFARGPTCDGVDDSADKTPEMAIRVGDHLEQYDQRVPHAEQRRRY